MASPSPRWESRPTLSPSTATDGSLFLLSAPKPLRYPDNPSPFGAAGDGSWRWTGSRLFKIDLGGESESDLSEEEEEEEADDPQLDERLEPARADDEVAG